MEVATVEARSTWAGSARACAACGIGRERSWSATGNRPRGRHRGVRYRGGVRRRLARLAAKATAVASDGGGGGAKSSSSKQQQQSPAFQNPLSVKIGR